MDWLTVADAPNLLVAGKAMATSFLTNSVTRLHPNEWASGTAAGVAAAMMSALNLSSEQLAADVSGLQGRLRSLGVPLTFDFGPSKEQGGEEEGGHTAFPLAGADLAKH